MANFNPNHKAVLDEILLGYAHVSVGKMFGYPAYFAAKKMCICVYEEGVGIKLPKFTVDKLLANDPQVIPFVPMGRHRMREWVQINAADSENYRQYQGVFEESITYVMSQLAQGK